MKKHTLQRGFTIVELTVTMIVFAILISIATLNLVNINRHTSVSTAADRLVSDLREQQVKAMIGDTEGRTASDNYGVYFGTTNYTLFHGLSFNVNDSANFVVPLETNLQFATPGATLVFLRVSGNVATFSATRNLVTVKDTQSQEQKGIKFNRFGVITQVQ